MEADGVLAKWLDEEDPDLLLVAIKGIGLSYTEAQFVRLSQLAGHSEPKIAASAREVIAVRAEKDQFLKTCAPKPNNTNGVCRFNRTPASFFH